MDKNNPAKGWYWELSDGEGTHNCCLELYDQQGQMLAFIKPRPPYCDRGHFQVCLEARGLNLDEMDGRSLMYYMDLEVAMWETVEFLVWRLYKISYQHPKGGMLGWAHENMTALGRLVVMDVEHRTTFAPRNLDAMVKTLLKQAVNAGENPADVVKSLDSIDALVDQIEAKAKHSNIIHMEHEVRDPAAVEESVEVELDVGSIAVPGDATVDRNVEPVGLGKDAKLRGRDSEVTTIDEPEGLTVEQVRKGMELMKGSEAPGGITTTNTPEWPKGSHQPKREELPSGDVAITDQYGVTSIGSAAVEDHIAKQAEALRKLLDQDFVACEKRFYQYVFKKADGGEIFFDQDEVRVCGVVNELNAAIARTRQTGKSHI